MCRKFALEGFCRHGEQCAYKHNVKSTKHNQNELDVIKEKVEKLEVIMNNMATQIAFLQRELTAEKCREKSVVETNYNHEISSKIK